MINEISKPKTLPRTEALRFVILIILGLAALSAFIVVFDHVYLTFADARFPGIGTSAWLATLWGVVSRAHLLLLIIPLVLWRPRLFGFQIGKIKQHGRLLLVMLLANCGVIATYLWLTSGTTPYSGNQWLVTEMITVPVVEELFWRGLVFSVLLLILRRRFPENTSNHWAVWLTGLSFGFLHANNALYGVPVAFVAIQVLNASIWGVVYSYARAKTESIYPPIFLHAAMNLVVVLF